MEQLRVDHRSLSGPSPNYSYPPKEVGIFSLTSKGFFNDNRNLKYYKEPADKQNVKFDLNDGYPERFVEWTPDEAMGHIFKWIKEATKTNTKLLSGVDFVTLRGHLTKVTSTPYASARDEWTMAVTKFNGTWYMSEVEDQWDEDLKMSYWGHKFEQYLTADRPHEAPKTDGIIDLNEGFYTVVRSQLNAHSVLFSAEIDGRVADDTVPPPTRYVEMKTNTMLGNEKQLSNFHRFKLRKCWVQSYLVGVPEIVFGFRDDGGVVRRVESYRTRDIPAKVAQYDRRWSAAVCMNFCDKFLSYVKRCATEDNPRVVYLFKNAQNCVTCEKQVNSKYTFLPGWYTGAA